MSTMKAWLAAVCILSAAVVTGAQPKKSAKETPAPARESPFDDGVARLPAGFKGNSFPKLYRSLVTPPKGEFETTEQFEARRTAKLAGKYAFRVENGFFTYNADENILSAQLQGISYSDGFSPDTYGSLLVLHNARVEDGSYLASNAFGASRRVRKVVEQEWGVTTSRFPTPKMILALSPDRARVLKPRLGVLMVCEFGPESIPNTGHSIRLGPSSLPPASGYAHEDPTITTPLEHTTYYYTVPATILGYWLFDRQTGEVLGRFDEEGNPGRNPGTNP
jgi:hypothetical protein